MRGLSSNVGIKESTFQHLEDKKVIRNSPYGFIKVKLRLTNLISIYNKVTDVLDRGTAMVVIYLDFNKTSTVACHNIS